MRKFSKLLAIAAGVFAFVATSCGAKTAEIGVVIDIGSLMDGGFNQGTYEGAKSYGEKHNVGYQYYQPDNGENATDEDRIAAMRNAVSNGAKVVVTPGFLQATALETVAKESPDTKFVFVDGWNMGLQNLTAISYKEQESGFLAGYAAVKDGYTKLGGTFGGGGANPACNRFAYGYVQGASKAATEMDVDVSAKLSFKYGASFTGSVELQTQVAGWYATGTEVVFACGGTMFNSVKAAAEATDKGMIIGVDVDQASLSSRVLTSATKGLATSVELILEKALKGDDTWDKELADKTSVLGAKEDAVCLPTAKSSWRFIKFTLEEYNALFEKVAAGTIAIDGDVDDNMDNAASWSTISDRLDHVTISFE